MLYWDVIPECSFLGGDVCFGVVELSCLSSLVIDSEFWCWMHTTADALATVANRLDSDAQGSCPPVGQRIRRVASNSVVQFSVMVMSLVEDEIFAPLWCKNNRCWKMLFCP